MVDLSRPWPLGLGDKLWWRAVLGALVVLAVALLADRALSLWAQSWPEPVRGALAEITPFGESDWILYPSGALFAVTALVALFVRWRLMRTLLRQFAVLYAFIFVGVGLPSLFTTLAKRLIGRGRPDQFEVSGLLGFHPNWLDWTYQSFPSGHATTAFALAATIGFVSPRWFYPALGFAAAIALSRVSLGVHYPSDVTAGTIVGLTGAYSVRWFFAQRRWMFRVRRDGSVEARAMSSLKRYQILKRRRSAGELRPSPP